MKSFDIREELQKYIVYLERHVILQLTNQEADQQIREVIKSLNAILEKTEKVHY